MTALKRGVRGPSGKGARDTGFPRAARALRGLFRLLKMLLAAVVRRAIRVGRSQKNPAVARRDKMVVGTGFEPALFKGARKQSAQLRALARLLKMLAVECERSGGGRGRA